MHDVAVLVSFLAFLLCPCIFAARVGMAMSSDSSTLSQSNERKEAGDISEF